MRGINKLQILTTDRVDINGNLIPPDSIIWDDYDKNPVLLYNAKEEGHYGVVIGKVVDRQRVTNGWAGKLLFMERNEDADIAFEKYSQGVLQFVSIGGYAAGEEIDGVFYVYSYRVREFSLVKFPANMDCKAIDVTSLKASEKEIIKSMSKEGLEIRYLTMGVNDTIMDEKEEREVNASEETPVETEVNASEETPVETPVETEVNASEETPVETPVETEINASEETPVETPVETEVNASEETPVETPVETEVNASEEPTKEVNASAESPLPDGMQWHEQNNSQNDNFKFMEKTFRELNCDADFQKRLHSLNAAYRTGAKKADMLPEHGETVKILASAMLQEEKMVILASATNVTDGISKGRRNGLEILLDCAAGGATAATLAAADLGVIKYLSLFYDQLLANDTFRRSLRFVPMSDRTGAIYIESAINPPTYTGNVTPINVQRYFYDDIKRTLARRVFTFAPITFQHADLAVLAYDKQSLGITMAMDKTMQDISTYWLQVIANTPNITKIKTSGASVPTQGLFPIEAPNSNINVRKPILTDIVSLESAFLMQNYDLNGKDIELVLPARIYSMIAGDPEVRNRLTRELEAKIGSQINFSATRMTPRNPVARFNTTSGNAELDPSLYADNAVADNGTFTPITPATTGANHVGAGVAFVANEVLAGIGAIELIVMPDPINYGTTISGWVSTGATVARQNAVGAALLVPDVVTP